MIGAELSRVISTVSQDKNLDKTVIVDALEQAMLHAARKDLGATADLEAQYNEESDEIELFQFQTVVEDDSEEIDVTGNIGYTESLKLDEESEIGDAIGIKVDTAKFGRIAAQSAKQIIVQKVREAERSKVYDEYKDRIGEVVSGHVQRFERNNIIIDLGQTEAVINVKEQIPSERYKIKDRITGYILEVKRSSRGPQIIMSRAHPGFLVRLFEQNVMEIYDGIVTIEAASRDPGNRSKIAVFSRDSSVDPVGACVGMKGARVQAIVQELNGEKIDIIPWNQDSARLVCNALAPAVVSKVIVDEDKKSMEIIVSEDQLSLAIGKRGQNVRLAAQLTGWTLDIKSEAKLLQQMAGAREALANIAGVGEMKADILLNEGVKTPNELANLELRVLMRLLNLEEAEAEDLLDEAAAAKDNIPVQKAKPQSDDERAREELFQNAVAKPEFEDQVAALTEKEAADLKRRIALFMELDGVGEAVATSIAEAGYITIGDIAADAAEEIANKTDVMISVIRTVQISAERYLHEHINNEQN